MEEEKRGTKAPPNKQLIMDIGKTKYTVNLHFKQGTGETYKDKILKLIKRETEKIEYSGAAEPLFRKSGNRLSGIGNRRAA